MLVLPHAPLLEEQEQLIELSGRKVVREVRQQVMDVGNYRVVHALLCLEKGKKETVMLIGSCSEQKGRGASSATQTYIPDALNVFGCQLVLVNKDLDDLFQTRNIGCLVQLAPETSHGGRIYVRVFKEGRVYHRPVPACDGRTAAKCRAGRCAPSSRRGEAWSCEQREHVHATRTIPYHTS